MLSHIGLLDERKREYAGARGSRFAIFPGSALFKKSPTFVMAAELVETSRLWARVAAKFDPLWAEQVAPDLVKRSYSEPHWSSRQGGAVMAHEKVTLYGVPIIPNRRVNYGRVDPELSRELFIRHALVEGEWKTHHKFFHRNRALLQEIEELETRMRRRDILVDDQTLFEFYDARVGKEVVSERHFDKWWKDARQSDPPDLLDFDQSLLMSEDAEALDDSAYPKSWLHKGFELPLSYEFHPVAPGSAPNPSDGVTAEVPVLFLNQLDDAPFRWQIPGQRVELVTALIKSLPKQVRKNFVPAPDVARQATAALEADFDPATDELEPSLELVLRRLRGHVIPPWILELGRSTAASARELQGGGQQWQGARRRKGPRWTPGKAGTGHAPRHCRITRSNTCDDVTGQRRQGNRPAERTQRRNAGFRAGSCRWRSGCGTRRYHRMGLRRSGTPSDAHREGSRRDGLPCSRR